MDPTLPSQILETLRANRDQILTHWQQARPELQSLASATLDDMKVELFDKQGQSRTTFLVSVGDHDAVMTVETPDPYTFSKRAQASTRDALKQAWLENKIPVANPIGNSFDMTFGEQNYQ